MLRARKDKKCNHFNKASVKLFARNFLEFILKLRARKDTKCNHFNAAPIATSLTTKATWLVVLSHTNHRLDDKATKHGFEGRFGASCPSRVGPVGLGACARVAELRYCKQLAGRSPASANAASKRAPSSSAGHVSLAGAGGHGNGDREKGFHVNYWR